MKLTEKISYIQANHFCDWLKTREVVENEMSEKQALFCVCGRLATGLHEMRCQKFKNKVTSETVKRLKHLIPTK